MSVTLNGSNGITFNDGSSQTAAASPYVLKNRIINGDMRIDQRNAGASSTPTASIYVVDRWNSILTQASKLTIGQNLNSVTAPVGFSNYAGFQSTSAYSITSGDYFIMRQSIEGYNFADLGFGTSDAKTVTLSFWVRSSLTGTFGGAFCNYAFTRSYPFTYTISSANTWEQKTITIAGDTSGTWVGSTNAGAASLSFGLGVGATNSGTAGSWQSASFTSATGATSVVGTSGATFYITGVQLEIGTSATPFERRLYNQELANCQRYYEKSYPASSPVPTNTVLGPIISLGTQTYAGGTGANQMLAGTVYFKVTKRATPTITIYSWTSSTVGAVSTGWTGADLAANTGTIGDAQINGFSIYNGSGSNVTTNGYAILFQFAASAEL
jgi:hypothetical protein